MVPRNPKQKVGSRLWAYLDKNDDEIATAHFYEKNGRCTSPPDPLTVTVGSTRYVRYPDDLDANPEKKLTTEAEKNQYKNERKIQCFASGALAKAEFVSLKQS